MHDEKKWWKKFNAYQIVTFILTILFVIGVIVTICLLVNLKQKTDDAKKKNDQIEDILNKPEASSSWQHIYEKEIINLN